MSTPPPNAYSKSASGAPTASGIGGNTNNKTKNGFGSGATFAGPSLGVNINVNGKAPASGGIGAAANPGQGVQRNSQFAMPEPAFYSPADVLAYCNALRAFCAYSAIEVGVGAEILKTALGQTGLPGDNPVSAKLRARKIARKLALAGEAMAHAAALSAATWAAFQREYSDVLSQKHSQQGGPQRRPFEFN